MSNPLTEYQNSPNLVLEGASHAYRYYGVDREPNLEAIEKIEAYLAERYSDFHRFCNFQTNKDGTKSVRMLAHYSSSFIGVAYVRVDEVPENV